MGATVCSCPRPCSSPAPPCPALPWVGQVRSWVAPNRDCDVEWTEFRAASNDDNDNDCDAKFPCCLAGCPGVALWVLLQPLLSSMLSLWLPCPEGMDRLLLLLVRSFLSGISLPKTISIIRVNWLTANSVNLIKKLFFRLVLRLSKDKGGGFPKKTFIKLAFLCSSRYYLSGALLIL